MGKSSDLRRVIVWSKRFEAHLARRYGATGRGLHEKIDSAGDRLEPEAVRHLRYVATVRNKLLHEDGYDRLDDRRAFKQRTRAASRALGLRPGPTRAQVAMVIVVLVGAIVAVVALSP